MARLRVGVTGTRALVRTLRDYRGKMRTAVEAAMYQVAEEIVLEAKKLTPVLTGALRASGHVGLPHFSWGGKLVVEMGFGGPAGIGNVGGTTNATDVGYAQVVHDDLTMYHRVGQAHYLKEPLDRARPHISERLARRIRAMVRHGVAG